MPEVVLVAPSAFKGSLDAFAAADAIAKGVRSALPDAVIVSCPIADGGDGTAQVLAEHLSGEMVELEVTGPLSDPITASFAWLPTEIAVVDVASAGGWALVPEQKRDPMVATTRGVGELMSAALSKQPRRLIVGAGGSATADGGAGLVQSFGVGLFTKSGSAIAPGPRGLKELDRIDLTFRNKSLWETEIIVACDVTNPLLGPRGTAQVFGPQKGASPEQVAEIEAALEHYAEILLRDTGKWIGEGPRLGAAGGAAAGMWALMSAELRDGFDVVAEMIDFDQLLSQATLLIVGEGSLDAQSLEGKAPVAAARRAKRLGIPAWAFAGKVELDAPALKEEGIEVDADLSQLVGQMSLDSPAEALATVSSQMLRRHFS